MPVPTSVRKQIPGFLDADDEVRYVFPAEVAPSFKPYVLFVVSRKRITILGTAFWSRSRLTSVQATLPRQTRLGPVDTHPTPHFEVGGIEYELDDEYVAVVHAADADSASAAGPQDPLPDL